MMKWIKINKDTKIKPYVKIAFLTNHIMFPDNAYFGIYSDVTKEYHTDGKTFERDEVTHFFYVEKVGVLDLSIMQKQFNEILDNLSQKDIKDGADGG